MKNPQQSEDQAAHPLGAAVIQYRTDGPLPEAVSGWVSMETGSSVCARITVISRRKKLIDPDNIYCKKLVDSLKGVVLPDDSARHVRSITIIQEKVQKGESPETIIEVEIGPW